MAQLLVDALMSSVPSIGHVLVMCAFIWVICGVVGVSMFAGRLWRCLDSRGNQLDPKLVPDRATCHMLGFAWMNRPINFDNLAEASLALLQLEEDQSDASPRESQQRRYAKSLRRLLAQKPVRLLVRPAGRVRGFLYDLAASKELALLSASLALLNGVLLASERHEWSPTQRGALGHTHLVFLTAYAFELLVRAVGTGTAFFTARWNQFELCTLILSLIGALALPSVSPSKPAWVILRGLRSLAVLRMFRSVVSLRGVRQLVLIFASSVPAFINIALLLFLVMFVYAVLGVSLFGNPPLRRQLQVVTTLSQRLFYSTADWG
ncbi:hypothetical protein HPB48_011489 [Haemaphysalis longicornis]|uniref:Ion transport domain-containing protein n=1 Tax=Haemaphysalis longicornis TaxID=44386 RepID=A0A9J6GBD7_HAELO|nr:hypothetical protein HPB48_011489 [Haemaphysalis longicornis]